MKLTKSKLKVIIKEELKKVLKEWVSPSETEIAISNIPPEGEIWPSHDYTAMETDNGLINIIDLNGREDEKIVLEWPDLEELIKRKDITFWFRNSKVDGKTYLINHLDELLRRQGPGAPEVSKEGFIIGDNMTEDSARTINSWLAKLKTLA